MEVLKENQSDLSASTSSASYQELLDSQKDLFRRQIDQLENIVDAQCTLTGINPLSQEMAAGALSIKIGKRPRDLLNPKAIKYMQSIFSIKDAITKKESREISALFGVTATQVREFFASQRSRVRKFVRLSREKAIKSNEQNEAQDEPPHSDPNIPINTVPLDSVCPTSTEGPSFYAPDEILPGIDDSDKHFLESIFSLMRKEETFSGQVELMEKILHIQNTSVLYWFLTKGGVMILATWLSQAAVEEQTTVLHVILKVLCHLPLHKALPVHMSAILQSVNKLRFYRTSDISNRARILLSRWSKIFARSQAMRKPNAIISLSDAQDEMLLKRSIGEIMENESRESKADIPEETCTPSRETLENSRKLESPQPLKLLTESTDDPNKKLIRGVSSSQNRGRRKVQLVEQPGQKTAGRNPQAARSVQATQGRPLSADDIQKAKMRAHFMQNKYGKAGNECLKTKIEGPNTCSSSQASILLSTSKAHVQPIFEEHKKRLLAKVPNHQETNLDNKSLDPEEPSLKKWKRVQIPWQKPPETRISDAWRVGTGQNSKEVEVQKNRIRREKEIMYRTVHEIPSDPKEPWDREMDYDDTLTPEILTEQLPDVDGGAETVVVSPRQTEEIALPSTTPTATTTTTTTTMASQSSSNGDMPEPDLELLAVLLKNPELVFALTSGQGGSLSSEETVKLLDMIKANGVSSVGSLTGLGGKPEEKVEVSLPSPTPSSNPTVSSGWRQEFTKNPFSQQNAKEAYDNMPGRATAKVSSQQRLLASMVAPQQPVTLAPMSKHAIHQLSLPQTAMHLPEKRAPPPAIHSLHRSAPINSPNTQTQASETVINPNNFSASTLGLPNLMTAVQQVENVGNARAAPVSVTANAPGRAPAAFHLSPLLRTSTRQQPPPQQHHLPEPQLSTHSWRARQGLALNSHRDHRNEYNNAFGGGGLMQAPFQPGPPPRERNELIDEPGFESWSPDNSPIRSPGFMMSAPGRPYLEPRRNLGHNYNYSPERSRQRNFPGYRDLGRNGNRRGLDRDRAGRR